MDRRTVGGGASGMVRGRGWINLDYSTLFSRESIGFTTYVLCWRFSANGFWNLLIALVMFRAQSKGIGRNWTLDMLGGRWVLQDCSLWPDRGVWTWFCVWMATEGESRSRLSLWWCRRRRTDRALKVLLINPRTIDWFQVLLINKLHDLC